MADLEERLRLAATRLPGPYRSEADESGPAEVKALIEQQPAFVEPAREILGRFLETGSVDEARLAAYVLDDLAQPVGPLLAGYRRHDVPSFERSKLAWALGRALLDAPAPLPAEVKRWVQDRNDGPAFWAAFFVRDRAGFDRDASLQIARDALEAGNQLWFAASIMRDAEYDAFVEALRKLEPSFGAAWVQAIVATLAAVRSSAKPADHALPARG